MPRVLVCDWDETITTKDTTLLVAQTAYVHKQNLPPFDTFVQMYLDAAAKFAAQKLPRLSVEEEEQYQRRAREMEMVSIGAIERAGIFLGLTRADFEAQALQVVLRPGFVQLVAKARETHTPIYIVSVNWSKTFIEAALALHGVHGIVVRANDFEFDNNGICTGKFDRQWDIRTGADKKEELESVRAAHAAAHVIYVGDSSGDVLPLRVADTGVVMRGGRARDAFASLPALARMAPGVFEGDFFDLAHAW